MTIVTCCPKNEINMHTRLLENLAVSHVCLVSSRFKQQNHLTNSSVYMYKVFSMSLSYSAAKSGQKRQGIPLNILISSICLNYLNLANTFSKKLRP